MKKATTTKTTTTTTRINNDADGIMIDDDDEDDDYECWGMSFANNAVGDFCEQHCIYLLPMLGWFFFSALLSSYNKYVFGAGHMAFPW
jgi:hypothetical protein